MPFRPASRASLATAALAALAALGLAACDSGGGQAESGAADGPSVIAPGKPGEDNRTLSPSRRRSTARTTTRPTPPTSPTPA